MRVSSILVGTMLAAQLVWESNVAVGAERLSFKTIGFYGVHLDVGDFAFLKFTYTSSQHRKNIPVYNRMLEEAAAQGKVSIVGLYTFDRVTHKRPIAEYVANTDSLLKGLRRDLIYAVCPSEENVTWNNGLAVLNALYDCVAKWKLPCYQWLTMPDPPHGKLKADGWILDAYGYGWAKFRRHLAKFVITGKPVIVCVNATSPLARTAAEKILPGAEGSPAEAQMKVCREFNVPVFFYAVDKQWGNVHAWLRDTDELTVACKRWALSWISRAHSEAGQLPLPSANYLSAKPMEVCGGEDNSFVITYDFSDASFLDFAGVEGLLSLRWDGMAERLTLSGRGRRRKAVIYWHLISPLKMKNLSAELDGSLRGSESSVALSLGTSLIKWYSVRRLGQTKQETFTLKAAVPEEWTGKDAWVMVALNAGSGELASLGKLRIQGTTVPPAERVIRLQPGQEKKILYEDTCISPKMLHLAEIEGRDRFQFKRGCWYITGIDGRPNEVTVKLRFVSNKPLCEAEVRIDAMAWTAAHRAKLIAALSADGKTALLAQDTAKLPQHPRYKRFAGTIVLPLSDAKQLQNAREFWLIIKLISAAGKKTGPSCMIRKIQMVGRAAR